MVCPSACVHAGYPDNSGRKRFIEFSVDRLYVPMLQEMSGHIDPNATCNDGDRGSGPGQLRFTFASRILAEKFATSVDALPAQIASAVLHACGITKYSSAGSQ